MDKSLQKYSLAEGRASHAPLARGIGWGAVGGLVGTMVMDILLMGTLLAVGRPALLCFSIVGDTVSQFFSISGIQLVSGVPAGIATHYIVGPLVGAIFGVIVAKAHRALRVVALKKCIILAVLYVEILSQPLLATTPVLLKMTTADVFQWFLGAFPAHLMCGMVLGLIVHYGLKTTA